MSVTVNGTNGLTFADGSTQATGFVPGMRNRIINGDMRISQRNGTSSVSEIGNGQYTLDRWQVAGSISYGAFSIQQSSTAPTGYINSTLITVTTSSTCSVSTESYQFQQKIEGLNICDLNWGTSSASSVTISFWVRSSVTGSFGGAITNNNYDWTYPFSYTINSANTWEQKTVTIPGPTSGTWLSTNGTGIQLTFGLGANTARTATANVWANSVARQPTGAVNLISTNGATFYITGVQLEKGSVATPFEYRQYGTELALCQRYYETSFDIGTMPANGVTVIGHGGGTAYGSNYTRSAIIPYKCTKRTAPTLTFYRPSFTLTNGQWAVYSSGWLAGTATTYVDASLTYGFAVDVLTSSATFGSSYLMAGNWTASAEL